LRNVCFLVVDDSAVIRKMVHKAILNRIGAGAILEAGDGNEALQILAKNNVDFILSDWEMPGISGEELIYRLRNSEKWKSIPFIMMTSHGERDFIITAIQNGVSEYLVKPFSIGELEDKIRKCWNATTKRKATRYAYMPKHQMMIKLKEQAIPAQIFDISRTGVLVNLGYNENLHLFESVKLSIEFEGSGEHQAWAINPLPGRVIRLEAEGSMDQSSKNCLIAIDFTQSILKKEVENSLNGLLEYLGSLNPESIHE